MFESIQSFFLDKLLGKLLIRAGILVASYLASGKLGASINVDPNEITLALGTAGHWLLDLYKNWRNKKAEVVPVTPLPAPVAEAPQVLAAKEPADGNLP